MQESQTQIFSDILRPVTSVCLKKMRTWYAHRLFFQKCVDSKKIRRCKYLWILEHFVRLIFFGSRYFLQENDRRRIGRLSMDVVAVAFPAALVALSIHLTKPHFLQCEALKTIKSNKRKTLDAIELPMLPRFHAK